MSQLTEDVPCPLCGSNTAGLVVKSRDFLLGGADAHDVVACAACGHCYTNPRPSRNGIGAYYPDNYEMYMRHKGKMAVLRDQLDQRRARALARRLPPSARVLEVGCSTGEFLARLRDLGLRVEGLEFSAHAATIARERFGLDVRAGLVEDAEFPESEYSLIVMRHVLEHLFDPVSVCRRLAKALRPGGLLSCTVPNIASVEFRLFRRFWSELDLPRHLQHFTPETISRLFGQAGLEIEQIRYSGVPNGWVRSLGYMVSAQPDSSWRSVFSPYNPFLALLLLPLSVCTATLHIGGRVSVLARKK